MASGRDADAVLRKAVSRLAEDRVPGASVGLAGRHQGAEGGREREGFAYAALVVAGAIVLLAPIGTVVGLRLTAGGLSSTVHATSVLALRAGPRPTFVTTKFSLTSSF